MNNFKIDFIGIGAPRCGTTWIYKCLQEHPDICVSEPKETRFFEQREKYSEDLRYYKTCFKHCRNNKVMGEFSVQYFVHPEAPQRIKKYFPKTKLIVSLRNPAERAYSHYNFHKALGFDFSPDFEAALKNNPKYIEHGRYFTHLMKWYRIFPKEQILVLIYEESKKNPGAFIKKIYHFLEVDDEFTPPSLKEVINPVREKNKRAFYIKKATKTFKEKHQNDKLLKTLKALKINKLVKKMGATDTTKKGVKRQEKEPMKEETKKYLENIYLPEIEKLEKLLGPNLNTWKKQ